MQSPKKVKRVYGSLWHSLQLITVRSVWHQHKTNFTGANNAYCASSLPEFVEILFFLHNSFTQTHSIHWGHNSSTYTYISLCKRCFYLLQLPSSAHREKYNRQPSKTPLGDVQPAAAPCDTFYYYVVVISGKLKIHHQHNVKFQQHNCTVEPGLDVSLSY